jgi:excisionase family DNA binding protein
MSVPERDKPWSVNELAEAAGVFPTYVRRLCAAGKLSAYKVGRDWLIPAEAGQQWLDERRARRKQH